MFHVGWFVHPAGDFDAQIFVGRVFGDLHFVPLGNLALQRRPQSSETYPIIDRARFGTGAYF